MFRTARISSIRSLPVWMVIILAILVNSLIVHFLLEDPILLSSTPETVSSVSYNEELNHQDDLTLAGSSPARIPNSQVDFVLSDSPFTQDQALFPHFNPPKNKIV